CGSDGACHRGKPCRDVGALSGGFVSVHGKLRGGAPQRDAFDLLCCARLLAASWSYATLLRPDGALLAVASCLAIVAFANRSVPGLSPLGPARAWRLALSAGLLSVDPFAFWTARNLRTFHG